MNHFLSLLVFLTSISQLFLFNFQCSLELSFLVGTSGLEPPTSRLSGVRSNHLSYAPISWPDWQFLHLHPFGGDEEDRTPDTLRARQVLSQLSYTPVSGTQMPLLPLFEGRAFKIEQHFRFAFQLKLTESYERF